MTSSNDTSLIHDPLLMAFDTLPSNKMLNEHQVALLLECKPRWLEEQRSRGLPPPYVMLGDRMVRYAVGPLRQWLHQTIQNAPTSPTEHRAKKEADELGLDEPILRGGHRKQSKQSSFTNFLTAASPNDEWPFVFVGPGRRPVDAIGALTQVDTEQVVDAGWLRLNDYADALKVAAAWMMGAAEANQRHDHLPNTPSRFPDNPRQRS